MTVKPNLDIFERKVVFRTARGYFIALAIMGILSFVGGMFMGANGMIRISPNAPAEPEIPAAIAEPTPIDLAAVKAHLSAPVEAIVQEEVAQPFQIEESEASLPQEDPRRIKRQRTEELLVALEKLYPSPEYAWNTQYEMVCSRPSSYGCLQRDKVVKQRGMVTVLSDSLTEDEAKDLDVLNPILESLIRVLEKAPAAERGELMIPIIELHRRTHRDYRRSVLQRELKLMQDQAAFEAAKAEWEQDVDIMKAEKDKTLWSGIYAIAAGLGILVCVGVFLAHLAIERHLRELRELLAPAKVT